MLTVKMKKRIALITGITGQDGSYLSELLLGKDYEVHGIMRRSSSFNTGRINHIFNNLQLHFGDMNDANLINKLVKNIRPTEIYNLAAQSHVKVSFDIPSYTVDTNISGTLNILEAIKENNLINHTKFYQAGSSEMFGDVLEEPQNENTPFNPVSPYACSKVFSHYITKNYRKSYKIFASNGILFNHESPRRGETFVTKKITKAAAKIKLGLQNELRLGNIESKRDWGFAGEYVEAMWLMLQHKEPDDFVIGTGKTHSVKTFLKMAFEYFDLNYENYLIKDPNYFRPSEVKTLLSDPKKAKTLLNWEAKFTLKDIVYLMCNSDYRELLQSRIGE